MIFSSSNSDFTFCIGMTMFNRSEYLRKTLDSLSKVNYFKNTKFFLVDDCSTDEQVGILASNFIRYMSPTLQCFYLKNSMNVGSKENYLNLIKQMKQVDADFYIIIDSDCIFNSNWLCQIQKIISLQPDKNTCVYTSWYVPQNIKAHYSNILESHDNYNVTMTVNGTGMVLPKCLLKYFEAEELNFDIYNKRHFDGYVSFYLKEKLGLRFIGPKVSYMDHFGIIGVNSSTEEYCERATDFIGEN